jgi:hypothetical protein
MHSSAAIVTRNEQAKTLFPRVGNTQGPPPAGSVEEYTATVLTVGFPPAIGVTCDAIERLVRSRLLLDC